MNSLAISASDARVESVATMTVEEALLVPWLSYYPKPLGELMHEGYLDLSRLEWAAQKAYNPRLKRAAQVLLDKTKDGTAAPVFQHRKRDFKPDPACQALKPRTLLRHPQ